MRLILNFIIGLICGSYAFEIEENHYKVLNGVKALSNVMERVSTHSSKSCATKCARTNGCTHANFWDSTCEFLNQEIPGIEIGFETENDAKFLCEYNQYNDILIYMFGCQYLVYLGFCIKYQIILANGIRSVANCGVSSTG